MGGAQDPFAGWQVKIDVGGAAPRLGQGGDAKGGQGDAFAVDLQARAGFASAAQIRQVLIGHGSAQADAAGVENFHQRGAARHTAAGGGVDPGDLSGKGGAHLGALVGDAGALQVEAGLLQLCAGLRVAHAQPLGFGAELFVKSAAADFQQALVGVVFCHPRLNGLMLQSAGKQGALILLHLRLGDDPALL